MAKLNKILPESFFNVTKEKSKCYYNRRRVLILEKGSASWMFGVGDYIIYGSSGVCEVMDIGPIDDSGRDYYTLRPVYIRDSSVLTPIDNDRVVMRSVMTRDEAKEFLSHIEDIGVLEISDERKIDQDYKKALLTCDPKEIVKTIKTIYFRMETRQAEGKKVTANDSKYFHLAEDSLYGELAISLDMNKDEVKDYIRLNAS